jgi:myosin heavy subunit
MGILALLDEESLFPKATDTSLLNKLNAQFAQKGHPKYRQPRFSKTAFGISHYAGDVEYEITGWLDKNKDPLQEDLSSCMKKSTVNLVANLFLENITGVGEVEGAKRGKGSNFITVGYQYKVTSLIIPGSNISLGTTPQVDYHIVRNSSSLHSLHFAKCPTTTRTH